jgi:hypothetical protein
LNTGEDPAFAKSFLSTTNTLYIAAEHPSALIWLWCRRTDPTFNWDSSAVHSREALVTSLNFYRSRIFSDQSRGRWHHRKPLFSDMELEAFPIQRC